MNYPTKGAVIRFGRHIVAAGAAAAVGVALKEYTTVLDGTSLAVFIVPVGAAIAGLDKFLREKGVYGSVSADN